MSPRIDITGKRFGKLVALELDHRRKGQGLSYWKCRCDCKQTCTVYLGHLRNGRQQSCGCGHFIERPKAFVKEGVFHLPLGHGKFALLDIADALLVSLTTWHISSGYPTRTPDRLRLHKLLFPKIRVDHKNGDKLDNRRGNLREATASQQSANTRRRANSQSGFKGVGPYHDGRWRARLAGKFIGYFLTAEEAARAYDDTAREKYGEFACVNFPLMGERAALRATEDGQKS